jgi:hypothetical protein
MLAAMPEHPDERLDEPLERFIRATDRLNELVEQQPDHNIIGAMQGVLDALAPGLRYETLARGLDDRADSVATDITSRPDSLNATAQQLTGSGWVLGFMDGFILGLLYASDSEDGD